MIRVLLVIVLLSRRRFRAPLRPTTAIRIRPVVTTRIRPAITDHARSRANFSGRIPVHPPASGTGAVLGT
jgi:hypothetical protein